METSNPEIIVIDDEIELRDVIVRILNENQYPALPAASAEEGLALIERTQAPLVICDISMPKISGLELLATVRKTGLPCSLVMLTAHDDRERGMIALRLGAIDYVIKPVEIEALLLRVPLWLEISKRFQKVFLENRNAFKMLDLLRAKQGAQK